MIDGSIERPNLYVQAQITLDLTPASRRRRMLLQEEGASVSRNKHFSGAIGVIDAPLQQDDDDDDGTGVHGWEDEILNFNLSCNIKLIITGKMMMMMMVLVFMVGRMRY
eukprot:359223_1